MNKRIKLIGALLAAGLVSATAFAADSTTTTTGTTGTTTTPTAPKPTAINSTDKCSGGGTRTLSGSWDSTSGAIDTTTTLNACVLRNGETHNGTTSLVGTLLATKGGFTIDVTSKVDTTIDRTDGSKLARKCTTIKKGTYTNSTQIFDGSTSRSDCSLVGQVREHENVAENLLRDSISDDEDGGFNRDHRLLPKEKDTDSADDDKPATPAPAMKPTTPAPEKPETM